MASKILKARLCLASACRYFIDKLRRAVEKDADFVISSSSAYKGTAELEMVKSSKTSDFSEVFLYIALALN